MWEDFTLKRRGRLAGCGSCIVGVAAVLVGCAILLVVAGIGFFWLQPQQVDVGSDSQVTPVVGGMIVPSPTLSETEVEPVHTEAVGTMGRTENGQEPSADSTFNESPIGDSAVTTQTPTLPPPTLGSVSTATALETDESTGEPPGASVGASQQFSPGDMVFVIAASISMYVEADGNALLLDSYPNGALFTVLEPSGDDLTYPVVIDGTGWVRVRAEDGLVGWVEVSGLVSISE